ncbi:MAG: type II CRISPR-associated endonuclease Cas1 [Spirochaetales bacterium]|nr:type II CRISPR-associated endonuclease Cas1 [Spirochaetales bacterium]
MLPSVVEIQSSGLYLSKTRGFLSIKSDEGETHQLALDEIGVLLLSSPKATLSTSLMNTLAERGIITVLCDQKHRPASYLYPFKPHEEITGRLLDQIQASLPLKKRIWQSVVRQKILHQGTLLENLQCNNARRLLKLATEVTSGDSQNREAQAARIYWSSLLGKDFRRKPRGEGLNNLLDFGYGILRAAILRAIAGAGINPSLGVSHISRSNPFCLADDLMESYRPLVDFIVFKIQSVQPHASLCPPVKAKLGLVLTLRLQTEKGESSASRSMSTLCQSLYHSYETGKNQIEIPQVNSTTFKDLESVCQKMDFS